MAISCRRNGPRFAEQHLVVNAKRRSASKPAAPFDLQIRYFPRVDRLGIGAVGPTGALAFIVVLRNGSVKASVRGLPIKRAERKAANFGIGEDLRIDQTVCVPERPEDQSVGLDLHGNALCRFPDPKAGFSVLLLLAPMQPRRRPSRP